MRTFGLERAAVADAGWNFVVSDVSLSYKEPARLDDQLHATAVISAVGGAQLISTRRCAELTRCWWQGISRLLASIAGRVAPRGWMQRCGSK